jgi:sensor histidine kinase YesM
MRPRKKFLINPAFQLRFMFYMILMTGIAVFVFFLANQYFFYSFRKLALDSGLSANHVFMQFVSHQQDVMLGIFLITGLIVLVMLCAGALFFSHRAAGPLYRLTQHMNSIADGQELSEVSIREKDFFPELPQAFNRLLKRLRTR